MSTRISRPIYQSESILDARSNHPKQNRTTYITLLIVHTNYYGSDKMYSIIKKCERQMDIRQYCNNGQITRR